MVVPLVSTDERVVARSSGDCPRPTIDGLLATDWSTFIRRPRSRHRRPLACARFRRPGVVGRAGLGRCDCDGFRGRPSVASVRPRVVEHGRRSAIGSERTVADQVGGHNWRASPDNAHLAAVRARHAVPSGPCVDASATSCVGRSVPRRRAARWRCGLCGRRAVRRLASVGCRHRCRGIAFARVGHSSSSGVGFTRPSVQRRLRRGPAWPVPQCRTPPHCRLRASHGLGSIDRAIRRGRDCQPHQRCAVCLCRWRAAVVAHRARCSRVDCRQ